MTPNAPSASIIEDLEDLYENAPCGYLSLEPSGRIFKVNRTLSTWTGYAPDQLVGKRLHDLLSIAGRMFYETHIAPLLRMQGFFNEVALDLITDKGERLPVIANATERRDADGRPISTRITLLKATDRRRYERELLDARDQSRTSEAAARASLQDERETSELREQFIAVLGHDLRNPLASISAGARILLREPKNETETRVLQMMQTTVMRMSGLIDNVLDFARGRLGGGITLSRDANRPLEPVLQQVVDEFRSAMPDRMIESDFKIADPVNCDRSRIGLLPPQGGDQLASPLPRADRRFRCPGLRAAHARRVRTATRRPRSPALEAGHGERVHRLPERPARARARLEGSICPRLSRR